MNREALERYRLTKAEYSVLEVLWGTTEPLTKEQINQKAQENGLKCWKDRTTFNLIGNLTDKKLIVTVDSVRTGRNYARRFRPAMSKATFFLSAAIYAMTPGEWAAMRAELAEMNEKEK